LNNREDTERHELASLAPFAAKACQSRGRVYPQEEHPLRTAFQRDRDRIVHSAAFRRMEYKTQVFLPHETDHFRTRLTHTIEVAQVARTLARNLRLNEDLTEAIALVHDLGHTPFGHSGEDVLNRLLAHKGGFNHNRQSLRVVDLLEQRYREHPGLNLSYEVREGIVKHETSVKLTAPEFEVGTWPTLEASLVDQALAYSAHDIDDGLSSGLIGLIDLQELAVWRPGSDSPGFSFETPGFRALSDDQKRHMLVRYLIDHTATDLLGETDKQLSRLGIGDLVSLQHAPERVCRYSTEMDARVTELKRFLFSRLYRHEQLTSHAERARVILEALFAQFCGSPERLPERFREMLLTEETEIVVADYIAGMTDRFAERLFGELA
jgi:dGTPase